MEIKQVENIIYELREPKVMLDYNLSTLYEVETKALNQVVKRNLEGFPEDFIYRITSKDLESIRSQIVTASQNKRRQDINKIILKSIC